MSTHGPHSSGDAPACGQVRTFVAVLLPDDVRAAIAGVQAALKRQSSGVRWVAEENLHLTLKFLGDVEEDRLPLVEAALKDGLAGAAGFELGVAGTGAFPSPSRPSVLWVGLSRGASELSGIAARVEDALGKIGFDRETKPFRCHATIGRCRDLRDAQAVGKAVRETVIGEIASCRVSAVALMKSDLRPDGPVYTKLVEVELSGGRDKDVD